MSQASGLTAYVPERAPTTGAVSTDIKKLTEGVPVTVNEAQTTGGEGPFDFLDGITRKFGDAAGSIFDAFVEDKVSDIRGNPQAEDTTGDPMDQPGGGEVVSVEQPLMTKYKTPIMIGAGVLGLALIAYMVKK